MSNKYTEIISVIKKRNNDDNSNEKVKKKSKQSVNSYGSYSQPRRQKYGLV